MSVLTLPARRCESSVVPAVAPEVFLDGRRRRDLEVLSLERLEAPHFARATLAVRPPADPGLAAADWPDALPAPGAAVSIRTASGTDDGAILMEVVSHSLRTGPGGRVAEVGVLHRLAGLLERRLADRWELRGGEPVHLEPARVRMNVPGGWTSPALTVLNGRAATLFSTAEEGRWSVGQALLYLFAAAVPLDVDLPSTLRALHLAGGVDLGPIDLTGASVGEAVVRVADRAGLAIRAAADGLGILLEAPGTGRRRSVRLQPCGESVTPAGSTLLSGRVDWPRRPGRRGVLALAARKRYEVTLALRPGWDAALESPRWRDFLRAESPDWPLLRDVFRRWVLNEHARYAGAPWNLPVFDFAAVEPDDFRLRRPRRLLPCLSAGEDGESLGVVVEWRPDDEAVWRAWPGPLRTAPGECAVRFDGDALPAEYFQAAVAHTAEVRVTATVEADARLTAEVKGDANVPPVVLDFSDRAAWWQVHASSVLGGVASGSGVRDDTDLLERLAEARAAAGGGTDGRLVLAWPDLSFAVGDLIERLDGRAVSLASRAGGTCHVARVRHEFADTQTTTLDIEEGA